MPTQNKDIIFDKIVLAIGIRRKGEKIIRKDIIKTLLAATGF